MTSSRNHRTQGGFTLVEIAIVLVIIGLLLGGVLKGQEIVKNAKVKAYKTQVDAITAAYNAYLDRYHALPGDDPGAVARLNVPTGTYPNIANGDGSGVVNGAWNSATLSDETNQFFMHLAAAGLIKANANAATAQELRPKGPNGEPTGVGYNLHGIPGLAVCFGSVLGEYAGLADLAFDDGRPGSGNWRVTTNPALQDYPALDNNYIAASYNMCVKL